jgi:hypothetical protein
MDSSKLAVKLFVKDPAAIDTRAFIPLFHEWIQTHAVPGHMLIDVADYRHVENGPGTVLVAHEANFSMDSASGRLGLLYTRKQPLEGNFAARLSATFRAALRAAALIESAPVFAGKLRFRTDELLVRINDRLAAPNTHETWTAVGREIESLFSTIYGSQLTSAPFVPNPETLFEVRFSGAPSESVDKLLKHTPH